MNPYISLLRGINVSGQKAVRMPELKAVYESLGFSRVRTYLQSGNVVFESPGADRPAIAEKIEAGIQKAFGFHVPVLLRAGADFQRIIASNPFLQGTGVEIHRLYVTFLSGAPEESLVKDLAVPSGAGDEFRLVGKEIFLHCPGGYGRTAFSNTFFEKKLRLVATTRNWKTVSALAAMSSEVEA